jgi:catechol 2,3-dioxygenase-like lactoylglutathione lyase family enzyme
MMDDATAPAGDLFVTQFLVVSDHVGGGPTEDKPTVRLAPPADPDVSSGFLNLRVRDIAHAYRDWPARGAAFLTEPKDHGYEIRACIRDPNGHLIEVGQAT